MSIDASASTVTARRGMVAAADRLATESGVAILAAGGNAVDAAIATNAVMAVVGPHLCGLGGDLFALVHDGDGVHALNASGRAGSGADASRLRAEGHRVMPFRHDIRSVTVPGCVDGWIALHARFATLPLAALLAAAIDLAEDGFPASSLLVAACARLDPPGRASLAELASQAVRVDARVRRPGVASALRGIAAHGRSAFYDGPFGAGLLELGRGWFDAADLRRDGASWVEPLRRDLFGSTWWTTPPNSQGYLLLGSALIADSAGLPADAGDPRRAHVLIEASKAAGRDRPDRLHDAADGNALLDELAPRRIDPNRASSFSPPSHAGDTTYLCVVDEQRMAVSLIQSNASGLGSWLTEPNTGINLHNRGIGFSIEPGHPAELAPGRRPPHTLCPALITDADGRLRATLGTMGGDGQPQILLQLATRIVGDAASVGESVGDAVGAPRWTLRGPETGFDTWMPDATPTVLIEGHAPQEWATTLRELGHRVEVTGPLDGVFGHAHAIVVGDDGVLTGAADPRTVVGSANGR